MRTWKREPSCTVGGKGIWSRHCGSTEGSQNIKDRITCNSMSIYLPKENKNTSVKRYILPYVHCSIIHNNQDMEATCVNRWMDKSLYTCKYKVYIYLYTMEYNSVIKNMKLCHFDNMDRSRGYYSKWNKTERERKVLHDLIYDWKLRRKQTKHSENKLSQRTKGQVPEGRGWEVKKVKGIERRKPPII